MPFSASIKALREATKAALKIDKIFASAFSYLE
jgi:hypothetical protein